MRRQVAMVGLAVVLSLSLAAFGPAFFGTHSLRPIDARAGCWNYACNGTDPSATGCSASYPSTVVSVSIADEIHYPNQSGEVDDRWSGGCYTNWSRVLAYSYSTGLLADIYSDLCDNSGNEQHYASSGTSTDIWTAQIYAPDWQTLADGGFNNGGGIYCCNNTGWAGPVDSCDGANHWGWPPG